MIRMRKRSGRKHRRKYKHRKKRRYGLWERIVYFIDTPYRERRKYLLGVDPHAYPVEPKLFMKFVYTIIYFILSLFTTVWGWIILAILGLIYEVIF